MSSSDIYKYEDADLETFMKVAIDLVKEAGKLVKSAIGKTKAIENKEKNVGEGYASEVLTETDQAVEKMLIAGLSKQFSDHEFIGEESMGESEVLTKYSNFPTWIIDPIDGTMNFVHANPLVCISVGLAINRKLVLGLVYNPITNHMYTAIKGKGAFLNGDTRLSTSGVKDIGKSMILMELPCGGNETKKNAQLANVKTFMDKAQSVRCPGPAALDMAWIAAGSADAFFHSGIHCWDMAAAGIIILEAGGALLNQDGSEFDLMGRTVIAAATAELAEKVAKVIQTYETKPRDFAEVCPVV